MIAALQRRPLLVLLALLAVLLLAAIAFETGFGTRLRLDLPQGPSRKAVAPDSKLLPPVVAVAPEQAYPEIAARPLFTPTRRPAPVEPKAGKPAFVRGQFVLQGVIAVGEERTALLREKTSGKIHRVDRGKDVNGLTVEKIEPTEVTLAMGGEREKLALTVQRPEVAGRTATPTTPEAPQGPFGAPKPAGAPATASAPATGQQPRPPSVASPAARATTPSETSARAQTPSGAPSTATQPMSPEELLARRRARRNQPTQ